MQVLLAGAHAWAYVHWHMHLHHGGGRGWGGPRLEPGVSGVGALGLGGLGRFLPGWEAVRQRVERQAPEDLEHRDWSRGEQFCGVVWSVLR